MPKNKIPLICIFLVVATLMAFWQVNNCDFSNADDAPYVTQNNHIQNGITMDSLRWAFTAHHAANWHPLTWISHMLDVQLFGLNPRWHHLTNLIFHIANTLLLFFVLHRMTKVLWQSAFVAALFALHPLHVESVAWVAERKDVLSTFFWMLTMGAYCYYVERPGLRRYLPVLLFFALGLMAKPMLVTLPFVLLLLDYWPLRRLKPRKSDQEIQIKPLLWEKIPLFALTTLSSVVTYIAQQKGGAVVSIEAFPLSVRMENAFISYVAYIGKMIWPNNLAVFYPYQRLWISWQVLGAIFFLIVVTLIIIWGAKRFQYLALGWFWYIGTLVPVIGLVQVGLQARADRYTYIPLIGLCIMMAWGIPDLLRKWCYRREALITLSAMSLACCFVVTWIQVGYWRDSITLFEHALKVTDDNYIAYNNRGTANYRLGKYELALADFNRAVEINPKYTDSYINRGNAYDSLGNHIQAIKEYEQAIEINPTYAEAYYNRGGNYAALGNYTQSINDYDKTIELKPKYVGAYYNRGNAYFNLGNYKQAIVDYDRAIEINPKYSSAYYNRAVSYERLGNRKQSYEDLNTAAKLGDKNAQNILTSQGINW